MSVVSRENMSMIHELMKTIISDNNLKPVNELPNFIESKCAYFHANRFEFGSLNEINKKIVEMSYNFIMSNQPRNQPRQTVQQQIIDKKQQFEMGLEAQKQSFDKMINPKKPKEIDFTDGGEDFPIENLDKIMNQTLADRQRELERITQQYSQDDREKAKTWLNTKESEESTPKIKIDNSSSLRLNNTIDVSREKRVRFTINEQSQETRNDVISNNSGSNDKSTLMNLFSKLKTKSSANLKTETQSNIPPQQPNIDIKNIESKLDTILSQQNEILMKQQEIFKYIESLQQTKEAVKKDDSESSELLELSAI
jgi:hypothetical protein